MGCDGNTFKTVGYTGDDVMINNLSCKFDKEETIGKKEYRLLITKYVLITFLILLIFLAQSNKNTVYANQTDLVSVQKDLPPIFIGKSIFSLRVSLETNEILLSGATYDLKTKIRSIYSTYTGNVAVYLQLKIGKLDSGIWYIGIINQNITEIALNTKFTVPLTIKTGDAFNVTLTLIPVERGETLRTSFVVEQIKTFGYDTLYNKELIRIDVGYPEGVKYKVILQGSEVNLNVRIENLFQLKLENVKLFIYLNKTLVYTQNIGDIGAQQLYSNDITVNTFVLKEGTYYITANITYMMENLYFSYGTLSSVTLDLVKPEVSIKIDKTTIVNGDQIVAKIQITPSKAISTISLLSLELVKNNVVIGKETTYLIEPELDIPLRVFILTENPIEVITLRAYALAGEKNFYSNEIKVRVISASAILNNLIVNLKVDHETAFEGETIGVHISTIPKLNITLPVSIERYLEGVWVTLKNVEVFEGEAYCTIQLPSGTNILRAIIRVGVNEVESQRVQVKIIPKPIMQIEGPKIIIVNTTATFYIKLEGEKIGDMEFVGIATLYDNRNNVVVNKSVNVNIGTSSLNLEIKKSLGAHELVFTLPALNFKASIDFEVINPSLNIIMPKTIEENSEFQIKVSSEQKISLNLTLVIRSQETGKNILSKQIRLYDGEATVTINSIPMGKYSLIIFYQNLSISEASFTVIRTLRNVNLILSSTEVGPSEEILIEIRLAPPPSATTIAILEIYSEGNWIPLKSIPVGTSGIVKDQILAPNNVGLYKLRVKVGDASDEKEINVVSRNILPVGVQTIVVVSALVGISTVLYFLGRRR